MTGLMWLGAALYVAGLLVVAANLWGRERKKRTQLEDFMGTSEAKEPLFRQLLKQWFSQEDDMSVAERLVRAGLPFRSVGEYYSAMLAYGVAGGAAGALAGWLFGGSLIWALLFGLFSGYMGLKQPDAKIKNAMRARSEALFRDIFFGIPQLQQMFRQYRNAMRAVQEYVEQYHVAVQEGLPEEQRQTIALQHEQSQATANYLVANALRGAGGNLFAEALNRFSEQMLRQIPLEEAQQETLKYYPPLPQLLLVLNTIVEAIGQGIDPVNALDNIRATMRLEMQQRVARQTARASLATLGAAGLQILLVLLLFAVPMLMQLNF